MLRIFIGIALLLVGVGMFIYGMYYGWVSGLPDAGPAAHDRYKFLSTVFGILTYGFIAAGVLLIVLAIRRMNANYRKEREDGQGEA